MKKGSAFLNMILLGGLVILVSFAFITSVGKNKDSVEKKSNIVIPSAFKEYGGPIFTTPPTSPSAKKNIPPEIKPPREDKIFLSGSFYASNPDYRQEYLIITADRTNEKPINITGWSLRSKSGIQIKIPQTVDLFRNNSRGYKREVILGPGEQATIITASSPIGSSFKINKCSGYLGQYKTFTPTIFTSCPLPKNEVDPDVINDACLSYIESLPSCKVAENIPIKLGDVCSYVISKRINHDACVEKHQNDKDFYAGDWRIYLERNEKLWKINREKIELLDLSGKIIDSLSY